MSVRRTVPITNIVNVAAGQTATIDLPTERRYHALFLEYRESGALVNQATMETAIESIVVKLDGRAQREFTAAELNVLNALRGLPFQAGLIPIWFSDPTVRTPAGEDSLAWALEGNKQTFQVEVKIAAGRTAPTLTGYSEVDNMRGPNGSLLPLGAIVKTRKFQVGVSATGIRTLTSDIPTTLGDIRALHFFEDTADDISNVLVQVDQVTAFERTRTINDSVLTQLGYTVDAAVYHVLFDETRRVQDRLPMTRSNGQRIAELRVDATMAAARDFTLLAEYIGPAY
jgi:hypothetical protein